MRIFGLVVLVAMATHVATYLLFDPRRWANETQEAIIERVVAEYCQTAPGNPDRYIGRTGAAASIAVKAGLGSLAYAEVIKCKAGI